MTENDLGNLFIVAAPSGGGKTTLVKNVLGSLSDIEVSISHTTRPMRPKEQEGVDYFFVDRDTFLSMVNEGEFLEFAEVFDHFYGTSLAQITNRLQSGTDILLDIDWQGAKQIKRIYPDAITVFVIPPSLDALNERLTKRRQDDEDVIARRMQRAKDELSHYGEFDYLIVNDHFDKALLELKSIVVAHRLRLARQSIRERKLLSFLLSSK